jgi:hypothetical protein
MFSAIGYPTDVAKILTYVFFNIFTILLFIVLESVVIEYTLVKTDTPKSQVVNVFLFVPLFVFSIVISVLPANNFYGIIPIVLGIVFYGMSQRHEMKFSSVVAAISIAVSAFFITPPSMVLEWSAFGIVSGVMTAMIVAGILLFVKTKNEFHIITTVSIALLGETIIGFLSPMELPLQLGLAFNLALIGFLLGIIFGIREFRIIFVVLSGILLFPYLGFSLFMQSGAGYFSLMFLATGIILILTSYLIYERQKEEQEIATTKE